MKNSLNSREIKIAFITGLALFAMFFGAGNMVFPLKLGVLAGQHIGLAIFAFIITGVGFPFLGLFSVALSKGDYWDFFKPLGKPLSFLVIFFLILILCFVVATPRTELIVYDTLKENFTGLSQHPYSFSAVYFAIVFCIVFRPSRFVDIIGWFLSPIKILTFIVLIAISIYFANPIVHTSHSAINIFKTGILNGYGTMDLIAAIFFGSLAYKNIVTKCDEQGINSQRSHTIIILWASMIAALFIGLIYVGLITSSAAHAAALKSTATSALIGKIASIVMGNHGYIFVSICVFFACIATASALTEVGADFLYRVIFQGKVSKLICLIGTLICLYAVSTFGFDKIMAFAFPILSVLYPVVIILSVFNIVRKCFFT